MSWQLSHWNERRLIDPRPWLGWLSQIACGFKWLRTWWPPVLLCQRKCNIWQWMLSYEIPHFMQPPPPRRIRRAHLRRGMRVFECRSCWEWLGCRRSPNSAPPIDPIKMIDSLWQFSVSEVLSKNLHTTSCCYFPPHSHCFPNICCTFWRVKSPDLLDWFM